MIEVVKEGKAPKNIRQIGQVSGNQKVYLEDYVITYLKQPPSPDENMRIVILYGKKEMTGDELCWFVNGAVGAEKDFFMEKTVIDQESWQRVNEMAGRFFPEASVLGWAIIGNESTKDMEEQILRTQRQFFRSDQKLYFEYNTEEKEEYVYLFEKGKMHQQSGYYIYYERNESMQNYMVSLRAAERHPEEFEADRAAQQFRERTSEKRQEIHRRRSAALTTCLSLSLMLVIMVIGVTMLNNYEKMQNMEQVLYQISGKIDQSDEVEEAARMQEVVALDQSEKELTQAIDEPAPSVSREELAQGSAEEQSEPVQVMGDTETAGMETVETETVETQTGEAEALEPETAETETDPEPLEEGPEIAESESVADDVSQTVAQQTIYVIQKGDTLAKICMKYYGSLSRMDEICEMNQIADKDNILYGQKIILP